MRFKTLFITGLGFLMSAGQVQSAEIWSGTGVHYNEHQEIKGNYDIQVENTSVDGATESQITISSAGKTIKTLRCRSLSEGNGWRQECSHGKGGTYCFNNKMCQSYVSDTDGRAFASTISFDGKNQMRILRTELVQGKAVAFYQETLHK